MSPRLAPAHLVPRGEAGPRSLRCLPSAVVHQAPQPEGLLQIHTAPHRGSCSAVLSQALRAAGLGSRVLVCQLLKGGVDQGVGGSQLLCGRLRWVRPSTPLCLEVSADRVSTDPEEAARILQAVRDVWTYSRDALLTGRLDQLVLDELGLAVELGYLPLEDVLTTLEQRPPHLDVIVTGPAVPAALMAMADQITELRRLT
ncbi:MAG: cob(I)yrinic acid a,c-diamide adenosyltransferase [Cyanobacteriota bacterium]|nr:cob(I)yrinic acid a,c-diamide adenosyltransferase [Cyanobacteriota bacterium]